MNVINFSNKFDPLLSTLNMAEFKGQNPLHLLISVPGITGVLMMLILLLMSLSSVNIIRNSSFDLFQIFHRLSVIFVLLLFLHPSSHVLKEQINVDRHHPDFCYPGNSTSYSLLIARNDTNWRDTTLLVARSNATRSATGAAPQSAVPSNSNLEGGIIPQLYGNKTTGRNLLDHPSCLDPLPLFVAQSSICCYVLSFGLSCYLLDLLLRKFRRSKSPIRLLDVRTDSEGNLIELILSNNHKRFARWLPGQFVYLNCPRIATFEWHPFTISSMDEETKQFTLHIKTGGDWTRKLRRVLERQQQGQTGVNSMSLNENLETSGCHCCCCCRFCSSTNQQLQPYCDSPSLAGSKQNLVDSQARFKFNLRLDYPVLPNFDCYNNKTGELQVHCTRVAKISRDDQQLGRSTLYTSSGNNNRCHDHPRLQDDGRNCVEINLVDDGFQQQQSRSPFRCEPPSRGGRQRCAWWSTGGDADSADGGHLGNGKQSRNGYLNLKLFIDGPFHSPFERLLDQEVSVCIANGVGWTAFSSVFQCITNNLNERISALQNPAADETSVWWTQWQRFAYKPKQISSQKSKPTKLSLANVNDCHLQDGRQLWKTTKLADSDEDKADSFSKQSAFGLFGMERVGLDYKRAFKSERLLETRLHLMIIVTSVEQLKPFYNLAINYFNRIQDELAKGRAGADSLNPIREIRAFLTQSTKGDLSEFCRGDNLTWTGEGSVRVNEIFTIQLAKPEFKSYLGKFRHIYGDRRKISVYCCGSYQVKKCVRATCAELNKRTEPAPGARPEEALDKRRAPVFYSYHEENF